MTTSTTTKQFNNNDSVLITTFVLFQVPPEYLFPIRETRMEMNGFAVYIRNLNLRFQLDKSRLGDAGPHIRLKCVANIVEVPDSVKETTISFYVPALERTRNHVSAHHRSSGNF